VNNLRKPFYLFLWILILGISYSIYPSVSGNDSLLLELVSPFSISADFVNSTVVQPNINYNANFTNSTTTHNWKVENIEQGQAVYFSLSPHDPYDKNDLEVYLFSPSGTTYTNILNHTSGSTDFLASWISPLDNDWILQINDSRDPRTGNFTYTLFISIPASVYSLTSADWIYNTPTQMNFTISHESHYWKVNLNENQNGWIYFNETTPLVLSGARVTIFLQQNPGNPIDSFILSGNRNYSLNAPVTDTYIVVISHNVLETTGEYSVSFSAETTHYNFETAEFIPDNQTIIVEVPQSFIPRKRYYFWFKVNISRTEVNIRVFEPNPTTSTVLNYAIVELFEEGVQKARRTEREDDQLQDGEFNISESLDTGVFFLVVSPESNAVGEFHIFLQYTPPRPFVWGFPAIIFTIVILVAFPVYLIYLDIKGRWYHGNQWTISAAVQETYKLFRNSFRGLYNIKEVPDESILIRVASIPFRTFALLNFIESSETETLVYSKRISRKYEWGIFFLIGLLVFDFINILSYLLLSFHLLPFYFPDLTSLILFLAVPTIVLAIVVLFTNISSYITYSQVLSRITYLIQNYQESEDETPSRLSLDPVQAAKTINYVRVLWNQARHAFKDHNYELFVIKADAAVKNLLSTRFLQMYHFNSQSKPDFQTQVAELRKRGFDLPNDKKIAHFRNLRNRIVHSSVTLSEKESVDCFAYYSTFITRLGLRPT
jgi:hypothetical protein